MAEARRVEPDDVQGAWTGLFADVQGFEGSLRLELQAGKGRVGGRADISLGEVDDVLKISGEISGEVNDDGITLTFDTRGGPSIKMSGGLFPLHDGGIGMCGTYEVTADVYSPLKAGAIAASTMAGRRSQTVEGNPGVRVVAPKDQS